MEELEITKDKITYENIAKVNSEIKTIEIQKKQYAPVSERINAYRKLFPNGLIETKVIEKEDGHVLMRAEIYNEDGKLIATGYAQEKENSTFINKTSYIENCETSAVGRALSMLGIIGGESVASAEEVGNAIKQQNVDKETGEVTEKVALITPNQIAKIKELVVGEYYDNMLKAYKVKKVEELTVKQASDIISKVLKARENG